MMLKLANVCFIAERGPALFSSKHDTWGVLFGRCSVPLHSLEAAGGRRCSLVAPGVQKASTKLCAPMCLLGINGSCAESTQAL